MAVHNQEDYPDDSERLVPLMEELGYPVTPSKMRGRLAVIFQDSRYDGLVAECDGTVAGFAGLFEGRSFAFDEVFAQVIALVVLDGFRSKGIGTALLKEAERWARSRGATRVILTSGRHREEAHEFYKKRGYQDTGLRFVKAL